MREEWHRWEPTAGATLTGTVLEFGSAETKFGVKDLAAILEEGTGKRFTVWLSAVALRRLFEGVRVGSLVSIHYGGKDQATGHHQYDLDVYREGEGELLKETPKNEGGRPEKRLHHATIIEKPTLSDIGIEKTQSHRPQRNHTDIAIQAIHRQRERRRNSQEVPAGFTLRPLATMKPVPVEDTGEVDPFNW